MAVIAVLFTAVAVSVEVAVEAALGAPSRSALVQASQLPAADTPAGGLPDIVTFFTGTSSVTPPHGLPAAPTHD